MLPRTYLVRVQVVLDPLNVFFAALPKSGATHINVSIKRLLGLREASVVNNFGGGGSEQLIDASFAQAVFRVGGLVFHHHVVANPHNVELLKHFGINPVVTVRSVEDSIVSFRDHLLKNSGEPSQLVFPILPPNEWWEEWDEEAQYVWLAFNYVPWVCEFLDSWNRYRGKKLIVMYERFYLHQVEGMKRILDFLGVRGVSDEQIEMATSHKDGRFNVGKVGRREQIPATARAVIQSVIGSWKGLL